MITLTKEWLQQTIAELEEERDATPGAVNEDAAMALAAMKLALASLEAEPVTEWTNEQCLEFLSIAFRHAEIKGDLELDDIRLGVKMVNGSRAAMLQGVENAETPTTMQAAPALDSSPKIAELPSGNSPVIPDGSEDTKRLDWLDAQNKRLNEYYGTSYGWKFDANFQRNAMMLNDSNYPVMSVRQAIDEAIAAAPQQEVKS
ncbi:hypothetical protein RVO06_00635 [Enterobacter hormaechei]|uniref:hypothetical protein n=1 Tax=Enterobacter hormaechei TaxID=158836 RepID=UPI00292876F6|nr:hypothetical protein [Enterobacter hormaechei]MDV0327165.1 hypothetical protein [Enterobacter hormaechei]